MGKLFNSFTCLSFFLLFFSCSHPNFTAPTQNTTPVDIRGIISLLYPNGNAGHACPCDGQIYTARHIIQSRTQTGYFVPKYHTFTWQDGYNNTGEAKGVSHDDYRDLGYVVVRSKNKIKLNYYPKAKKLPEIGEKVFWAEFDSTEFNSVKRGATVKEYFAGYVFTDRLPMPGASGSCIFNAKGEVLGVIVWGMIKNNTKRGVGVLIVD